MKKVVQVFIFILLIWILVTLCAVLTLPSSSPTLPQSSSLRIFSENSLTYPIPSAGSYCESWVGSSSKLYWTDLRSSYSSKYITSQGWTLIQDKETGVGLAFNSDSELDYSSLKWVKLSDVQPETNSQLFLIPDNVNLIFTRMYSFKDPEGNNLQTARLGVDYACNKQLFNHVPGASAFCRKDYIQMYLSDYSQRYRSLDLGHCYQSITPKSFLLADPGQCQDFLKVLENLLEKFNETSMPVEWIFKNALRHKGYGIKLLDYSLAKYFKSVYNSDYANCSNILPSHQEVIVQKYVENPALIEGRKFDFRIFVICINADPLIVGWAPENGHTRLSDQVFDKNSMDFTTHITANVANQSPESVEFLKKYRFNLRETGEYFRDKIPNVEDWLHKIAYPKIKQSIIHAFRATQQNFLIKRTGLFEFYGMDFIMDDSLQNFYFLEANRRPDVQEKNVDLQYREDMVLQDMIAVANYFLSNNVRLMDTDSLFGRLKAFVPLIDETKKDPYFGVLPSECTIDFKDMNPSLPLDPMIEPLKFYIDNY